MMPENWYTALLKRKATSGSSELVRQYGRPPKQHKKSSPPRTAFFMRLNYADQLPNSSLPPTC